MPMLPVEFRGQRPYIGRLKLEVVGVCVSGSMAGRVGIREMGHWVTGLQMGEVSRHSARRLSQSENRLCLVLYTCVLLDVVCSRQPASCTLPPATLNRSISENVNQA